MPSKGKTMNKDSDENLGFKKAAATLNRLADLTSFRDDMEPPRHVPLMGGVSVEMGPVERGLVSLSDNLRHSPVLPRVYKLDAFDNIKAGNPDELGDHKFKIPPHFSFIGRDNLPPPTLQEKLSEARKASKQIRKARRNKKKGKKK